jgi:tRNA modification GTPase
MSAADTIFALASAPGRGGVAVLRISGSRALVALKDLTGRADFLPRKAVLSSFYADAKNPTGRRLIDQGLVIYFSAPASFTGEDVVELQPHGSPAVVRALLETLGKMDGLRLAEPGEFTRRAFENGRLDLTEAEAIADLVNAETQLQREQALAQMGGALSALYDGWAERLKKMLAHIEADLEFPDEDLPDGVLPDLWPQIELLRGEVVEHLNDGHRGERLRDGLQIAVIGAPNAGKSSLVNALAQRDVAIVSDMAGTTRDIIEVHLDLGGYPVILADTAGLRPGQIGAQGHEAIESEGIKRALARARQADIRLFVFDGVAGPDIDTLLLLEEESVRSVVVINKVDQESRWSVFAGSIFSSAIKVSADTGAGLGGLIAALVGAARDVIGVQGAPSLTRARHREALDDVVAFLRSALREGALPELVAEDLRLAVRALGRITGRVDVEDLLDVIFRDFCIGK